MNALHRMFRTWLLLLALSLQTGAWAAAGTSRDTWEDAGQMRRDRQMALLSDSSQACRLNGQRPSRLLPTSIAKPTKHSGRSLASFGLSNTHILRTAPALCPQGGCGCRAAVRYDFIALRHIIR